MKYILGNLNDLSDLGIYDFDEFIPAKILMVLPVELYSEEIEWLTITPLETPSEVTVTLPDNREYTVLNLISVAVNTELKSQILAARTQAARIAARAKNRAFGEQLIDNISILNEDANIDASGLEQILLDQDLTVIREMLWTGSISSAYTKLVSIEEKAILMFGAVNYAKIKLTLEQYLGL